jgi:DNA-binding response OmpR family regulator
MSARIGVEILLVVGGLDAANQMQGLLEHLGHHVRVAATVLEALSLVETRPADLLIADSRQLEADADVVFRVLGRRQPPLLILPLAPASLPVSAADVDRWRVAVAQAQTLLAQRDGETLQVGDLVIDTATKRVTFRGQHIPLPPIQFRLLVYLAQNRGRVVGAQELLKAVWGYEGDEAEARELVKVHVRQIRRRLGLEAQHADYVQSVRGFGYLVSAPGRES